MQKFSHSEFNQSKTVNTIGSLQAMRHKTPSTYKTTLPNKNYYKTRFSFPTTVEVEEANWVFVKFTKTSFSWRSSFTSGLLLDPFQLMSCRWSVPSNLLTLCSMTIITNPPLWYANDSIVYTPRRQTSDAAWFQWHWHSSDRRRELVLTPRSGAILALCAGPHELTIVETGFSYSTLILSDAALVICSSAVVRYCCGPGKTCDTDSASYLLRHRGWIWESSGNSWRERERERGRSVCLYLLVLLKKFKKPVQTHRCPRDIFGI